jgi:hypothetical protein
MRISSKAKSFLFKRGFVYVARKRRLKTGVNAVDGEKVFVEFVRKIRREKLWHYTKFSGFGSTYEWLKKLGRFRSINLYRLRLLKDVYKLKILPLRRGRSGVLEEALRRSGDYRRTRYFQTKEERLAYLVSLFKPYADKLYRSEKTKLTNWLKKQALSNEEIEQFYRTVKEI